MGIRTDEEAYGREHAQMGMRTDEITIDENAYRRECDRNTSANNTHTASGSGTTDHRLRLSPVVLADFPNEQVVQTTSIRQAGIAAHEAHTAARP